MAKEANGVAKALDSMVGYLNEKYRDNGWSSAAISARLTACCTSQAA